MTAGPRRRPHRDIFGGAAVLALTAVAVWPFVGGGMTVGLDAATFFYPMYHFLGERLRAGELPGWNPYQMAGAPFAGDPESGWMYLPAMLAFGLLPPGLAAPTFVVAELALMGLGAYALARVLGLGVVAALVAAAAYEVSGFASDRVTCCPLHLQVAAWLPPALLSAELAIRRRSWSGRARWWGAGGFCLGQILAGWLGQGGYYAFLAFGGYVAYRTLVAPPAHARRWRARLAGLVLHGSALLGFGFALAAAGVLPRLAFHARSTLAEGYTGHLAWAAELGGWPPGLAVELLLGRGGWYAGGAVLALALIAAVGGRRQPPVPYFVALTAVAFVLAFDEPTPLHRVLDALLPFFAELAHHWPQRVLLVFYLGPALLAGIAVAALPGWLARPALLVFAAGLPVLAAALVMARGLAVPRPTVHALVLAGLVVAGYALLPIPSVRRLVPIALLLLVFADLVASGRGNVERGLFRKVDLAAYYDPGGAGRFLLSRPADQRARFFGYDPALSRPDWSGEPALYRYQFLDPRAADIVVNNRATLLGLHDLQGYNPLQLRRYAEYLTALNGHTQEYHGAYVFPEGLDSPLLDLLNARYVVVPAAVPRDRPDLRTLNREHAVVYEDERVRVLENDEALPRAWLVHEARQVPPGVALELLADGAVDPRRTALLEEPPPPLGPPADPAADHASIERHEPGRIDLTTSSDAPSLLVLSEVHDPAWRASVDGAPARRYLANHVLLAVEVPAGTHRVGLRYESRPLRLGLAISLVAYLVLGALVLSGIAGRFTRTLPGARRLGIAASRIFARPGRA